MTFDRRAAVAPATCLAAAALLLVAPATAHAQFGKLLKKAAGQAAGNAAEKQVANARPLTPVDQLQGLTADDLDKVLKGFAVQLEAAPSAKKEAEERQKQHEAEKKAYEKASAEYDKRMAVYQPCRDKWEAQNGKTQDSLEKKMNSEAPKTDEEKMMAQAQRAEAAAQRMANGTATAEDQRVMAEFQKNMASMGSQVAKMQKTGDAARQHAATQDARLVKACGPEPKSPQQPDNLDWDATRLLNEKAAKAVGMTPEAFRLIEEPAVAYRYSKVTTRQYSQAEADAINAKLDQLRDTLDKMSAANIPF